MYKMGTKKCHRNGLVVSMRSVCSSSRLFGFED